MVPSDWKWHVSVGWTPPGASEPGELPIELVALGDKVVPSHFTLQVTPPEPAGILIRVCYQVERGVITAPAVMASGIDATKAADVLRKVAPLKTWAHLAVTHLSVQMLLEQVYRQADAPALSRIMNIPLAQAEEYLSRIPTGQGPATFLLGLSDEDSTKLAGNPLWGSVLAGVREQYDKGGRVLLAESVPVRGPRRRNSVTKQHLKEVARVYRQAVKEGHPPTKSVAENFGASHSTAARWVGFARQEGILGPARQGRSGGEATD